MCCFPLFLIAVSPYGHSYFIIGSVLVYTWIDFQVFNSIPFIHVSIFVPTTYIFFLILSLYILVWSQVTSFLSRLLLQFETTWDAILVSVFLFKFFQKYWWSFDSDGIKLYIISGKIITFIKFILPSQEHELSISFCHYTSPLVTSCSFCINLFLP